MKVASKHLQDKVIQQKEITDGQTILSWTSYLGVLQSTLIVEKMNA